MKLIVPEFWKKKKLLSYILWPFSIITKSVFLLKRMFFCQYKSSSKIITVGNVTIGGAGKTPTALAISKILLDNKQGKIAVLTRGYKGSLIGPEIINSSYDINLVGDEALMMASYIEVCVSKDRLKGIKFLEQKGYQYIITDDGFQDLRFYKNLNILVVDQSFGFGNEMLFPAGPLRQTIKSACVLSDVIVTIGENVKNLKFDDKKAFEARFIPLVDNFNTKRVFAFAGIANPGKFFQTLKDMDLNIVDYKIFPDHYHFEDQEIDKLVDEAQKKQSVLVTTEKDFVRISSNLKNKVNYLPIELVFSNKERIEKVILSL